MSTKRKTNELKVIIYQNFQLTLSLRTCMTGNIKVVANLFVNNFIFEGRGWRVEGAILLVKTQELRQMFHFNSFISSFSFFNGDSQWTRLAIPVSKKTYILF